MIARKYSVYSEHTRIETGRVSVTGGGRYAVSKQ